MTAALRSTVLGVLLEVHPQGYPQILWITSEGAAVLTQGCAINPATCFRPASDTHFFRRLIHNSGGQVAPDAFTNGFRLKVRCHGAG